MEAVERAAVENKSQFSPHSADSQRFLRDVVRMEGKWLNTLRDGLRLEFTSLPGHYREPNNKSAITNMNFVREKVSEWLTEGHVIPLSNPAWCTSPLTVVQKYDPVNDVLKERLVLDMSRHVNHFIAKKVTKLDDLSVSEHMLDINDYMTSFDMKNQFFHVKLNPDMYKFFGFAIEDEFGVEKYYCFTVLIYGCKPAVNIVTKLILPVKSFLHSLGVKVSVFIDDGRVAASSLVETKCKTELTLIIFQLAGWNMNWNKCHLEPSQKLLHLGFVTDTIAMRYFVPVEKIVVLKNLIMSIVTVQNANNVVHVKTLATVLGKIISMLRSHGDILMVMSRTAQHELGKHVLTHGWNSQMYISNQIVNEFGYILNCLDNMNGQPIYTAAAVSHSVDLLATHKITLEIQTTNSNMKNLIVSDASDSQAFVYCADGTFKYVQDFEFTQAESSLSSGHRELLSVKFALEKTPDFFKQFSPGKIFWQTDSRNVFTFLRRGSRQPDIQSDVVKIKKLEANLGIKVVPVWTPREHSRIVLADIGSKFSNSTDEWSIDKSILVNVFAHFRFYPTIDAFASVHNNVCEKFFTLSPQTGSSGVNFFAQKLCKFEKYYCCPPVKLILPCFKKLCSEPGVQSLILLPEWKSNGFWPYFFNGVDTHEKVKGVYRFETGFSFSNIATSHVFSARPNFAMLALLIVS